MELLFFPFSEFPAFPVKERAGNPYALADVQEPGDCTHNYVVPYAVLFSDKNYSAFPASYFAVSPVNYSVVSLENCSVVSLGNCSVVSPANYSVVSPENYYSVDAALFFFQDMSIPVKANSVNTHRACGYYQEHRFGSDGFPVGAEPVARPHAADKNTPACVAGVLVCGR